MSDSSAHVQGPASGASGRGVVGASAALLALALASDDAEEAGVRADDVLADPEQALELLGGPAATAAARNAVVQRYGRVGALLVIAYEERWRRLHTPRRATLAEDALKAVATDARLEELLVSFGELDASALEDLLAEIDAAEAMPVHGELAETRRWLHATYAVAARDGTSAAHRAYMEALDRVMRLATPRIAS